MATIPVPGTVVVAGSQVGPSGDTGLTGVGGSAEEVGSIKAWPAAAAPASWMLCDGSALSRTLYPGLFAVLGTSWGAGDGSTTFNLPDMRGRFVLGAGLGTGLANRVLAALGGEEAHALNANENASHTHSATQPAHSHGVNIPQAGAATGASLFANYSGGTAGGITSGTATPAITVGTSGAGLAHENMPPFLVITYIIKVAPTGGATAQAPIADATQTGLMNRVSGLATDYVGGDNACHPRNAAIVGNITGDTIGPGAIAVPSYKAHPDALWSPLSAIDDHFDGATLDAKWTPANTAGMTSLLTELLNSHLQFGAAGAADNATVYAYSFTANLPTPFAQSFTITFCVKANLYAFGATTTASTYAQVQLQIYNASTSGIRLNYTTQYIVAQQSHRSWASDSYGASFGTAGNVWYTNALPRYWRLKYNQADQSTAMFFSETGQSNWVGIGSRTGAQTGLSTTAPSLLAFGFNVQGLSRANVQVDWIRYTNP